MAEDLCRKAGFMLPKSANTKEFLELIKTYPDVTADAVDSLLKTIKFNEKKEVTLAVFFLHHLKNIPGSDKVGIEEILLSVLWNLGVILGSSHIDNKILRLNCYFAKRLLVAYVSINELCFLIDTFVKRWKNIANYYLLASFDERIAEVTANKSVTTKDVIFHCLVRFSFLI